MGKEKISVSIDKKLLNALDKAIDKTTIRNRSQALEYLLRKALKEKDIRQALILAGGDKKSLRKGNTFKPLVKIQGEEVILHTIKLLKNAGVDEILVAAGPITDHVFNVLGDGRGYGVKIIYIKDENVGTAGVVKQAKRYLVDDFFVVSGDSYFDFDLQKMIKFHNMHNSIVTLAVSTTKLTESKDFIELEGSVVKRFNYTPKQRTFIVNAGVYIFRPEIFDYLPKKGSLEKDVFPKLVSINKVMAYNFAGKWKHIT
jgi:NDP-sugar pyrophosphorylase family protein